MPQLLYFAVYKPFQTLCQFSEEGGKKTLKDYFDVPKDVYPVGRLDYDSEGLLILTNDRRLNQRLLLPQHAHHRTYYVQVEGPIDEIAINHLIKGVQITVDGKAYQTKPSKAKLLLGENEPVVPERNPPIRYRKSIPAPWISLSLTEGKNRQVRKMCAVAGFPVLRLIRFSIERLTIEGLAPGEMGNYTAASIGKLLF